MKTKPGTIAAFVTPSEISEAGRLRDALKALRRQCVEICAPHIEATLDALRCTYLSAPTDSNLDKLRAAHIELAMVERGLISPTLRAIVDHALASCEARIQNFANPIIARALDGARSRLAEVVASEWKHFKDATGCELPADPQRQTHENQISGPSKAWQDTNPVVSIARSSVSRLEAMLSGLDTPDRLLAFLREHAL